MLFISWNVNGLRACMKKGFLAFYQEQEPDFLCLQETKMERGQADVPLGEDIHEFWSSAEKKGYSPPSPRPTVWMWTSTTMRGG